MKCLLPLLTLCVFLISILLFVGPAKSDTSTFAAAQPHDLYFGITLSPAASDSAKSLFFETGMNCVLMAGGGFPWSLASHKKTADDLQKRGLNVYMQLGSHYPDGSYLPLTEA